MGVYCSGINVLTAKIVSIVLHHEDWYKRDLSVNVKTRLTVAQWQAFASRVFLLTKYPNILTKAVC